MGLFDYFKKKPDEPALPAAPQQKPVAPPPAARQEKPAEPAAPQSFFGKLQSALKKTHDILNTDIRDLFKREGRLVDDEFLDELFAIFLRIAATAAVVAPATATASAVTATTATAATAATRAAALGAIGTIRSSGLCRSSGLGGSRSLARSCRFCLGLNLGTGLTGRRLCLRGFVFLHH